MFLGWFFSRRHRLRSQWRDEVQSFIGGEGAQGGSHRWTQTSSEVIALFFNWCMMYQWYMYLFCCRAFGNCLGNCLNDMNYLRSISKAPKPVRFCFVLSLKSPLNVLRSHLSFLVFWSRQCKRTSTHLRVLMKTVTSQRVVTNEKQSCTCNTQHHKWRQRRRTTMKALVQSLLAWPNDLLPNFRNLQWVTSQPNNFPISHLLRVADATVTLVGNKLQYFLLQRTCFHVHTSKYTEKSIYNYPGMLLFAQQRRGAPSRANLEAKAEARGVPSKTTTKNDWRTCDVSREFKTTTATASCSAGSRRKFWLVVFFKCCCCFLSFLGPYHNAWGSLQLKFINLMIRFLNSRWRWPLEWNNTFRRVRSSCNTKWLWCVQIFTWIYYRHVILWEKSSF